MREWQQRKAPFCSFLLPDASVITDLLNAPGNLKMATDITQQKI